MEVNNMKRSSIQQPNNCCNGSNGSVLNNNSAGSNNSAFMWGALITGGFGLVTGLTLLFAKSKKKDEHEDKKTENKMKVDEHKAEVDVRKHEKINNQDLELYRAKKEIDEEFHLRNKRPTNQSCSISLCKWQNTFDSRYPMPEYSTISHLAIILDCCPDGFKPAMLLHMLTMYGALCFSKVRAEYIDGKKQSPSLQVVIEGVQGSGKGNFNDIFKLLFEHVINSDSQKLQFENPDNIVQITGTEISRARFQMMLACNKGLHMYIMETEIDAVTDCIKKKRGLATELLRKAFSNENTTQDSMNTKPYARGSFPVYLNYTFTGTTKAIDRLFKEKDYEDGTASRICFTLIPERSKQMPDFSRIRQDRLSSIHGQIDKWRKKYCYQTDESKMDVPATETTVDLSYVNKELKPWYETMRDSEDFARSEFSSRSACIAFRCAMVMHMMAGCPSPKEWKKRRQICDLAVYIANFCMERSLYKSSQDKEQRLEELAQNSHSVIKPKRDLTDEEVKYWYNQHGKTDDNGNVFGYGRIANILGMKKDDVRNALKRYGNSLNR